MSPQRCSAYMRGDVDTAIAGSALFVDQGRKKDNGVELLFFQYATLYPFLQEDLVL